MFYYYFKTKLISFVTIASLTCFSTTGLGQTQTSVDSLYTVRTQLILDHQSTIEIDLQLHQLGNNPTCVIQKLDEYSFKFIPYQGNLTEQREQKMNLRLKPHYSYLSTINFGDNFTSVIITCTEVITPSIINELVSHFGYNGYEIH